MGDVHFNHASELATISTVFEVDGVATDPTTATFVVTDPDGDSNTYTGGQLTHSGTGAYSLDVSCTSTTPGVWTAVLVGTGTAADVDVVNWTTWDTGASLYFTPAELKSRKGITDKYDDLEILAACTAATQGINDVCDRTFGRVTQTRTIAAGCGSELDVLDLVSVTALKTDEDGDGVFEATWSASDYQLGPIDAPWKYGTPWPYIQVLAIGGRRFPVRVSTGRYDRVQIEGVWGWPRLPIPVKQAAAIVASDLLKLGGMSFGIQQYGEYGAVRARANPIAADLLFRYELRAAKVG